MEHGLSQRGLPASPSGQERSRDGDPLPSLASGETKQDQWTDPVPVVCAGVAACRLHSSEAGLLVAARVRAWYGGVRPRARTQLPPPALLETSPPARARFNFE